MWRGLLLEDGLHELVDVFPQRPTEDHLSRGKPAILVWRVSLLEDGLHELVDAPTPGHTVLKHPLGRLDCSLSSAVAMGEVCATWPVCDVPVFQHGPVLLSCSVNHVPRHRIMCVLVPGWVTATVRVLLLVF